MRTLNEFYNVFVIQVDNIKLINALHFILLLCNMNLSKYANLLTCTYIFGLTVLFLLYYFTIVAGASLAI